MSRLAAVTGATGFIGGHLVSHLLDRGWRVRALIRPGKQASDGRLEAVTGSLEDIRSLERLVEGADAVVHAAGLVKAKSRAAFFEANDAGTRRLIAAIGAPAAAPRVVLLSSLAAREPALSAYAASKAAGEAALAETNLPWTILRPPVVYGPDDPATLPFFRAVAKGIGPILAPDEARLSFLHVADLCTAVSATLDHPEATRNRIYEPDDGKAGGHAWPDLVASAGRAAGSAPRLIRVPVAVLGGVAALAAGLGLLSGRPAMLSPGKVREIRHLDWVSGGEPLGASTGWQPRWTLDDGFAQTVAWYRQKNRL